MRLDNSFPFYKYNHQLDFWFIEFYKMHSFVLPNALNSNSMSRYLYYHIFYSLTQISPFESDHNGYENASY